MPPASEFLDDAVVRNGLANHWEMSGFRPFHHKDTVAASQRMMLWPSYGRTFAF